uniref:Uncharacterized protein n=1 Tax=Cacopsylla melanoneura TaxID=428564 RepID=A0A8D8R0M9_9HEMI
MAALLTLCSAYFRLQRNHPPRRKYLHPLLRNTHLPLNKRHRGVTPRVRGVGVLLPLHLALYHLQTFSLATSNWNLWISWTLLPPCLKSPLITISGPTCTSPQILRQLLRRQPMMICAG